MRREYLYQVLKSTWGVSVRLVAEAISLSEFEGETISVTPSVHYHMEKISYEEREFVEKGLRLIADRTQANIPVPIVVCIVDIAYNPCDYQPEGLTCAVIAWAAQEFGFILPTIPVRYDKASNRYQFNFEEMQ